MLLIPILNLVKEFKEASKPIYFGGIFYKTDGTEKEIASYNTENVRCMLYLCRIIVVL